MFRLFSLSFYFLFLGINFNLVAMQPEPAVLENRNQQELFSFFCPFCGKTLFAYQTFDELFTKYNTHPCNCISHL
jgi:hypothetical protein